MAVIPDSIPTRGSILLLIFFAFTKPLMAILTILCLSETPSGKPKIFLYNPQVRRQKQDQVKTS